MVKIPYHFLIYFFDMLTHGHFYFRWPRVKWYEAAICFSTNERILKALVMVIEH